MEKTNIINIKILLSEYEDFTKIPNCIMNISKLHLRLTKLTTKYIMNNPINNYVIFILSNS